MKTICFVCGEGVEHDCLAHKECWEKEQSTELNLLSDQDLPEIIEWVAAVD